MIGTPHAASGTCLQSQVWQSTFLPLSKSRPRHTSQPQQCKLVLIKVAMLAQSNCLDGARLSANRLRAPYSLPSLLCHALINAMQLSLRPLCQQWDLGCQQWPLGCKCIWCRKNLEVNLSFVVPLCSLLELLGSKVGGLRVCEGLVRRHGKVRLLKVWHGASLHSVVHRYTSVSSA